MNDTQNSPIKNLFDSLLRLYKQAQLLLMDGDRLMGERGWKSMHNNAPAEFSNSLVSPHRWFARWIQRFYMPATIEGEESFIDRILFISIHFASDIETGLQTNVDEPLIVAGRLIYEEPMTLKKADKNYEYWMCKYWFIGTEHDTLKGWRKTGQSQKIKTVKGSETFSVPLYNITSSEKLKELVTEPLLAVQEKEKGTYTEI